MTKVAIAFLIFARFGSSASVETCSQAAVHGRERAAKQTDNREKCEAAGLN